MSRYCIKCGKASVACICSQIQLIESHTELIILQHPSEVKRSIGTAKILNLSLSNSYCLVGEDFSDHPLLNRLLNEKDSQTVLLYPKEGSRLLAIDTFGQRSTKASKTRVILIDGTWRKAYKIWQLSTNLHTVPSVHLDESLIGQYRIRKAPTENGLSTVEAGFHALRTLEPENATQFLPLLTAFNAMVEFQINQMPTGLFDKHHGAQSS
ncbi:MAG: DTW domain-containing protein [Aliivibrio sp.]|uniref:tRNA-uridine aminocarboxypropyltransferase n=1 Tax=Aliivibrio sp. TaxID=1872443 RepID=UPI001A61A718|nr:DTW domain-containing protein [Aliivibrio sp.]